MDSLCSQGVATTLTTGIQTGPTLLEIILIKKNLKFSSFRKIPSHSALKIFRAGTDLTSREMLMGPSTDFSEVWMGSLDNHRVTGYWEHNFGWLQKTCNLSKECKRWLINPKQTLKKTIFLQRDAML